MNLFSERKSEISEKTVVPLGWVLAGFFSLMAISASGAFWVSSVNFRLMRIEQHMGIKPYQTRFPEPVSSAFANPAK